MLTPRLMITWTLILATLTFNSYIIFIQANTNEEEIRDPSQVMKLDLKYIACEVCEHAIAELIPQIAAVKEEHLKLIKKKPIDEVKILEVIENICKPTNETGLWIRKLDIQDSTFDKKKYLTLVEPGGIGKCKSECLTIAKSCEDMFENELDMDDLSALLWKKSLSIDEVQQKVCVKQTKRCGTYRTPLPGTYKRKDYPFPEISEKDYEMEKLLASMKSMGLGGGLYDRDSMAGMMDQYQDELAEAGGAGDAYGDFSPYDNTMKDSTEEEEL